MKRAADFFTRFLHFAYILPSTLRTIFDLLPPLCSCFLPSARCSVSWFPFSALSSVFCSPPSARRSVFALHLRTCGLLLPSALRSVSAFGPSPCFSPPPSALFFLSTLRPGFGLCPPFYFCSLFSFLAVLLYPLLSVPAVTSPLCHNYHICPNVWALSCVISILLSTLFTVLCYLFTVKQV